MVQFLVFELKGFLFHWQPIDCIQAFTKDPKVQVKLQQYVLNHCDWMDLNRGTALLAESIPKFAARVDLPEYQITAFIEQLQDSLKPIQKSILLLNELKPHFDLYYVDDLCAPFFEHLNETYNLSALFNGGLISSEIQNIRPESDFYDQLLSRYQLNQRSGFLIESNINHIETMSEQGWVTWHFNLMDNFSYQKLRSRLLN